MYHGHQRRNSVALNPNARRAVSIISQTLPMDVPACHSNLVWLVQISSPSYLLSHWSICLCWFGKAIGLFTNTCFHAGSGDTSYSLVNSSAQINPQPHGLDLVETRPRLANVLLVRDQILLGGAIENQSTSGNIAPDLGTSISMALRFVLPLATLG